MKRSAWTLATIILACATLLFGGAVIAAAPGRYVYVPHGTTIWQYKLEKSGRLTLLTPPDVPVPGHQEVEQIVVAPHGRFAYAPMWSSQGIAQYAIDSLGHLHPLKKPFVNSAYHPSQIIFSPNGRCAYVSCSRGAVIEYKITESGALRGIGTAAVDKNPSAIKIDSTGRFAYVIADGDLDGDGHVINRHLFLFVIDPNGKLRPFDKRRFDKDQTDFGVGFAMDSAAGKPKKPKSSRVVKHSERL